MKSIASFTFSFTKPLLKKWTSLWLQKYFVRTGLNATNTLPKGPLLVLAPHPDDETLGCGALIARYRAQGHPVRILIMTNGDKAEIKDIPSAQAVSSLRRKEAIQACTFLGVPVQDIVFLSYPDQETNEHINEIEKAITSQLWTLKPALLLSPHHDDAHPDHQIVAAIIHSLVLSGKIACPVWTYPIWFWPQRAFFHLLRRTRQFQHCKVETAPYLKQKEQALNAYSSQFENQPSQASLFLFKEVFMRLALQDFEIFFKKEGQAMTILPINQ